MTLSDGIRSVTVMGDIPMQAQNAPLSEETVTRNLTKTGGTAYEIAHLSLKLDEGLMLPISKLNDLRRRAIAALTDNLMPIRTEDAFRQVTFAKSKQPRLTQNTARFANASQITEKAKRFFARIDLPLHKFEASANGIILPPVLFDSDRKKAEELLQSAVKSGAKSITVGNLGHLPFAKAAGLPLIGDFRLNVTNCQTASKLESLGLEEILLSPELTLPQIRDVKGNTAVTVYGRIPLMTLEKCVIREIADCRACDTDTVKITDRRGIEFPVLREWEHRNVIYNSLPTCMSDRIEELARYGIQNRHFIFTDETPREVDEVIHAFEHGLPLSKKVRRLSK
jgi:putative protease